MKHSVLTLLVALAGSGLVLGQPRTADNQEARNRVNRQFDQSAPRIGDSLPDLTVYTAEGKPLSVSSLKGSHTVLIFGCLT